MTTIEQTIRSLREVGVDFGECALNTNVTDAEERMRGVMKYFLGDSYAWLPGYDQIADWLTDNRKRGLLLMGECGLGKTVMATKVIPIVLHESMGRILHPVSAHDMNKREKELERMRVIVLDDIGVEDDKNDYGERRRVFADIVDRAERRGDILIITTNLNSKAIGEKYGLRILDRLNAITRRVVLKGKSFRK